MSEEIRIGVYVCHCGTNIAGIIDVRRVAEEASKYTNVVISETINICAQILDRLSYRKT